MRVARQRSAKQMPETDGEDRCGEYHRDHISSPSEREYGCGGGEIARKIADRLGWKLWDELLTCEIARLSNCEQAEVECREERVDPLYYRLFKSILRGSFEGSLNVHRLKLLDADSILRITERVVQRRPPKETASSSAEVRNIFCATEAILCAIFLYAPREAKIRRLIAGGLTEAEAEEAVDTVDQRTARRLSRNTSTCNGRTGPCIMPCSTRPRETRP